MAFRELPNELIKSEFGIVNIYDLSSTAVNMVSRAINEHLSFLVNLACECLHI